MMIRPSAERRKMNKRLYFPVAILAILAVGLTACNNPRAESAGVWYNPFSWGDQTLTQSLEAGCVGGATETMVANSTYPCPEIVETAPAPAPTDAEFDKGVKTVIEGPAIVQLWDGSKAGCWILKVDAGHSVTWNLAGHWWTFNSQSALESDWPNSLDQYTADNPQCTAALPAGALK